MLVTCLISFSNNVFRCFDNGYVGKLPVAWKEYCVLVKRTQERMDGCTGRNDIIELLLKTALNIIQLIDQSMFCKL